MGKKKIGMASIEIHNLKFKDRDQANKYANRLRNFIYNYCKSTKCMVQAIIGVSNTNGKLAITKYIRNGKRGRPKREISTKKTAYGFCKNDHKIDWHLHILVISKPSYAFWNAIKNYIDKNWNNAITYKEKCNIDFIEYIIKQSSDVLFCNYNYGNLEHLKYTLKNLYYEYLKFVSLGSNIKCKCKNKFMIIRSYFLEMFPYQKLNKVQKKNNIK